MYTRILVPIDGSPTSDRALEEASQLALLTGAQVRLLHIVGPAGQVRGFPRPDAPAAPDLAQARQEGQALLARAREQLAGAGVATDAELIEQRDASVARLVVEYASDWGASLIVLGTQGKHGIERMLLGSDAEQIARYAAMPVLLVRRPPKGGARAASA